MAQRALLREWRFVDSGTRDGFANMALDEALLQAHEKGMTPATLRVYGWAPPAYRILGLKVHLAPHRGNHSAAACFNASSFSDLTCQGRKIAGSAQFRRDDVLLQHGSLPVSPDTRPL